MTRPIRRRDDTTTARRRGGARPRPPRGCIAATVSGRCFRASSWVTSPLAMTSGVGPERPWPLKMEPGQGARCPPRVQRPRGGTLSCARTGCQPGPPLMSPPPPSSRRGSGGSIRSRISRRQCGSRCARIRAACTAGCAFGVTTCCRCARRRCGNDASLGRAPGCRQAEPRRARQPPWRPDPAGRHAGKQHPGWVFSEQREHSQQAALKVIVPRLHSVQERHRVHVSLKPRRIRPPTLKIRAAFEKRLHAESISLSIRSHPASLIRLTATPEVRAAESLWSTSTGPARRDAAPSASTRLPHP